MGLCFSPRVGSVVTMKSCALLLLALSLCWNLLEAAKATGNVGLADLPPRGWNSYDSFSWIVDEASFLQNAEVLATRLKPHGFEYVVVDYLWYRKNVPQAAWDSYGYDQIDRWGRLVPDPDRWPSSRGGNGFKTIADKVHSMGLKFGIHVMRGINTVAYNSDTTILDVSKGGEYVENGRVWHARDIGLEANRCKWMRNGFMSVNTDTNAGRAFLRSLYQQYAEWGVDFVKLDCVFGEDLDAKEIVTVSELLQELDRPILLSLSPGTSVTTSMAEGISNHVNMYRITGDDWDTWGDVVAHFDISRDFAAANKIGAVGLRGKSWPDLDMLPLGWLTDAGVQQGPHRECKLTLDEQKTQVTLWSMAKSPLMYGGDLRHIDDTTFSLITNPTLLEINAYSSNNMEFSHVIASKKTRKTSRALGQSIAVQDNVNKQRRKVLQLTTCNNEKARGWVPALSEMGLDKICWAFDLKNDDNLPFCLYKKRPMLQLHEMGTDIQDLQGKFHLSASKTLDSCLYAYPSKKTASGITSMSRSPCKGNSYQLWRYNFNGTLENNFSGLCATIGLEKDYSEVGGKRSWIATGRKGEIYISFFNLDAERTYMSVRMEDIVKFIGNKHLQRGSCYGTEVWTAKHYGWVTDTLTAMVEKHGSLLFVLNCNTSNH